MKNNEINYKSALIATCIAFLLFIIIVCCELYWKGNIDFKNQVIIFLGAIQSAALMSAYWEFFIKRNFSKEILELVKISDNIEQAGLLKVNTNFNDANIDWKQLISNAKQISIVVCYANSWRNTNSEFIKTAIKKGCTFNVYLPNPENEVIINELSHRFAKSVEAMKKLISDAEIEFKDLKANVSFFDRTTTSSYYLIDNIAIMSVYNHKECRSGVPVFQFTNTNTNNDNMYNFIKGEIDAIHENIICN